MLGLLAAEREAGRALQAATKAKFIRELVDAGLTLDPDATWDRFVEQWLTPTVCSLGARTYELISGNYHDWLAGSDLARFLSGIPHDGHAAMREAISRFLDPSDADVRRYLLHLMDVYFVAEASQLSSGTLAELDRVACMQPTFVLFLDTNVLLSILGLHGEGRRGAAQLLLDLTKRLAGRVDVRLYAIPDTVDETRAAISTELAALKQLRLSKTLAHAALATGDLGDVAAAYAEAATKAERTLTPDDFLGPYAENLVSVLRHEGIELYNAATEGYKNRDDVLADVSAQERFEKEKFGPRAKSWGRIRHDTVLWYLCHDKRPPRVESPTDAGYWVVTEDLRLTAFDAHKRNGTGIPVCVQPLALVQILQFWTGRTEGMEQALLGGLQLSLFPSDFDARSEHTTLAILGLLSRYENVGDLSIPTITHILVNGALRQKLEQEPDEAEQLELIKNELIIEVRNVGEARDRAMQEAAVLAKHNAELADARRSAIAAEEEARSRAASAESDLRSAGQRIKAQATQLSGYETEIAERLGREDRLEQQLAEVQQLAQQLVTERRQRDDTEKQTNARWRFLLRYVALPWIMPILGAIAAVYVVDIATVLRVWRWWSPLILLYLLVCIEVAHKYGKRAPYVATWTPFSLLVRARVAVRLVLGTVLLGLLVNILYDQWYKPLQKEVVSPISIATPP